MKIALCQINPSVGSFSSNIDLIERTYNAALKKGADLVVFPEMCITGYPPQDLLWKKDFITKSYQSLEKLSKKCTLPMIVGYVRGEGNRLFNSAALCQDGKICDNYDKILLPTYDVFDESRYFSAGKKPGVWSININDKIFNLGIQICEDLWDSNYDIKVVNDQKNNGADAIVNISASPYSKQRLKDRVKLIKNKIVETGLPILYCNLVGAQDELVFDGCSVAFDEEGKCIGQAAPFRKDILLVDFNDKKCIGSKHVHGISMPSKFSSKHSKEDAEQLAINLGIDFRSISIQDTVNTMENTLLPQFKDMERNTAEENIQARVRGNILMALSNKFGWLVLSTGNKTELALGYCTLYGDMSGVLSVISDLNKTDVYSLANWINESRSNVIPLNTITKPPSAELAPDQVDPFDYDIISPLVDAIIEQNLTVKELTDNGYEKEVINEVYDKIMKNEYKRRQAPIGIRISNKAFGMGRRFPIVNQYRGGNK